MRNLGEFFGHIVKGVKSDPRNNPAKRKQVVRKNVEEEQRGDVILRRTTIEEIELHQPDTPRHTE